MFQPINYDLFKSQDNKLSGVSLINLFDSSKGNLLSLLKIKISEIKQVKIPIFLNFIEGKMVINEEEYNKILASSNPSEEIQKTKIINYPEMIIQQSLIQFIFFNFSGTEIPLDISKFIDELKTNGEKLTIKKYLKEDGSIERVEIGEGFKWLKDNLKYFNFKTFQTYFGDKWKVSSNYQTGVFTTIYSPSHLITKAYIYAKRKYFSDNGITDIDSDDIYIYNKINEILEKINSNYESLISLLQSLSSNFTENIPLMKIRKKFKINNTVLSNALSFITESSTPKIVQSFSFFEISEDNAIAETGSTEVISFSLSTKYIGKINYTDITIFKKGIFNLKEENNLDLRCIFSAEPGKFRVNNKDETVEIMYFYGEPKDFRVYSEAVLNDCKILRPMNYLKYRGLYSDRIFFRYSGCPFTDHYYVDSDKQYFFIDIVF